MSQKNKKVVIIYNSKTGFTEKYANWIAEQLPADTIAWDKRHTVDFSQYNTVIYGSGFYAGKINGLSWFKKQLPKLTDKTCIVFATGSTPSESPEVNRAIHHNFTDAELSQVKTFYMQSGLCYERMRAKDRAMMAVFRQMIKKTEGESDTYKMLQTSYDFSKKEATEELVNYCKEHRK